MDLIALCKHYTSLRGSSDFKIGLSGEQIFKTYLTQWSKIYGIHS
jgi:hypothetical protein